MAEKKTELSIVLRAVDKATAVVRSVNKYLDKVTKPVRDFKEALGDLREKSGLDDLIGGFQGVGSALTGILTKVAAIGGLIGVAVAGLLSLTDHFDELGDKAEEAGVSVDFLAQMRYAAERSGASIEQLDGGLKNFSKNLGMARAGTGRMVGFLNKVSPALLKQLKGAKDNEQAFDLLADAMSKIEDPAKRAALAQATLGDASLAPLFSRGAAGIAELRDRYLDLAGSQKDAAGAAGAADDALKDMHAATDGVKAALVEGLAPALTEIIKQITTWLKGHRADVKAWALGLGKQIPAAFAKLVDAVKGAIDFVKPFVDTSAKLKLVILGLVAVIVGPLIASIISLGITIMATPVGWILAGIAAIAAAAYLIYDNWGAISDWFAGQWQEIKDVFGGFFEWLGNLFLKYTPVGLIISHWDGVVGFFSDLWGGVKNAFSAAWDFIKSIVDKVAGAVDYVIGSARDLIDFVNPFGGDDYKGINKTTDLTNNIIADLNQRQQAASAKVQVEFANVPKGTKIDTDPRSSADVDLSAGYQMGAL